MSFNLIEEPWVPVLTSSGVEEWSLRDALLGAQGVTRLEPSHALEWVPVFRLLLAIAIDASRQAGRVSWAERFRAGRFEPELIERYLAEVWDRFNLFDPDLPFGQVAGLEAANGEIKSTLTLFPEIASGNNVPLFSAMLDSNSPALTAAQAARRLLSLHAWDTAGLKTGARDDPEQSRGKTTGNPTGPLGLIGPIIPLGRNLFESLLLNFPVASGGADDVPAWRREACTSAWEVRPSRGLLDLLTWQSRRVRLVTTTEAGQPEVCGVVVTAGDRLTGINPDHEPHTAWRVSDPKKGGMSQRPVRHQPGRSFWRGMDVLVAGSKEDLPHALAWARTRSSDRSLRRDYVLDLQIVGVVYGNQAAVVEHVIEDAMPLVVQTLDEVDGAAIREALGVMARQAESVRLAINDLDDNLRCARGGEPTPWDKGQRPGERFIASLDPLVRQVLGVLSRRLDDIAGVLPLWEEKVRQTAWQIASPLLEEASTSTFQGRIRNPGKSAGRSTERGVSTVVNPARAEAYFAGALKKALPIGHQAEKGRTNE